MTAQGGVQLNRFRSRQTGMRWTNGSSDLQHDLLIEPNNGRETRLSPRLPTETVYRIARTRWELRGAYQLAYQVYLKHGFTQPIRCGMRVTPYHALPDTDVFVATQAEQVTCTTTLIKDGELGLPIETLYAEEIGRYRDRGSVIAEVGSLAQRGNNLSVLLRLINLTAQRAKFRGVDDLFIAVHPRHAKFYQRYLGFELIGPLRSYGAVCGQPAVALTVDLNHGYVRDQRACGHLFGVPFAFVDLLVAPMSENMRAEVSALAQERYVRSEPRVCAVGA